MFSKSLLIVSARSSFVNLNRNYASSSGKRSYKLVVLGGGTGGCATAARFANRFGKGQVAVVDPAQIHYYQPMWTLVGSGLKTLEESGRSMAKVLPSKADWIQQSVTSFNPSENSIITDEGLEIEYEYLVVALGLQLNYGLIKGAEEALKTPYVGSNYSKLYVDQTFQALKNFKTGNAIFTFPATPVKCAGAPQKIMYLVEDYLRKNGLRDRANVMFNTPGAVLFGVKKYADQLWKIVKKRNIDINLRHELVEVKPDSREAIFKLLDSGDEKVTFKYEMLHITPPMSAPDVIKKSTLADSSGFLNVDKETLQHMMHRNIFGIGDCTNVPTSKTAAAAAAQFSVLHRNLSRVMDGKESNKKYDGYTSCPLVTGNSKCILAEFDFDGNPLETFPIDQGKERRSMYHLKKDLMPILYWNGMLSGYWEGPKMMRKLMHLGMSK